MRRRMIASVSSEDAFERGFDLHPSGAVDGHGAGSAFSRITAAAAGRPWTVCRAIERHRWRICRSGIRSSDILLSCSQICVLAIQPIPEKGRCFRMRICRQHVGCHSVLICTVGPSTAAKQQTDDVCVAVGGGEVEWGGTRAANDGGWC
jgi:hypothetical protein